MSTVAPSFICAAGDSVMIHFLRKRCLSVSTIHTIWTRDRGAKKFGSSKDFEVRSVLEEPGSNGPNSYQVDRHGYLPKVKREIPIQLLDRAIDNSARSALTMNLEPDQRLAYDDLTQVIFYSENQCQPAFIMGPIRARPMEYRVAADQNGFSLAFIMKPISYKGHSRMT
jgi:hypothetical protein